MTSTYLIGLAAVGGLGLAIHYVVAGRYQPILSPDRLFILSHYIMLVGTLQISDPANATHLLYAEAMTYFIAAYALASAAIYTNRRGNQPPPAAKLPFSGAIFPRTGVLLLLASVAITGAYFSAVGYSAFFRGLGGVVSGSATDVATLRLDSYSGERYLAAGYVSQFKNALLPGLSLALILHLHQQRSRWIWAAGLILGAASTLALIGAGQRGPFVLFVGTSAASILFLAKRPSKTKLLMGASIAGMVFALTTAVLGRATATAGFGAQVSSLSSQLYHRVFASNQLSGQRGFLYTLDQPTRFGGEWLESLLGALPGRGGSTLASEIFELAYGTTRGTSPPSLVGSIHHNFGFVGLVLAPLVLAYFIHRIWELADQDRTVHPIELVGICGVTVLIGTWVASSPMYLLNNGAPAFALMWFWGRRTRLQSAHDLSVDPQVLPPKPGASNSIPVRV